MGLFMDKSGIPLAFLYKQRKSERTAVTKTSGATDYA